MIHFRCSSCGKNFQVKDEHAGRRTKCPKCGETIHVPAECQAPKTEAAVIKAAPPPAAPPAARVAKRSAPPDANASGDVTHSIRKAKKRRSRAGLLMALGAGAFLLVLISIATIDRRDAPGHKEMTTSEFEKVVKYRTGPEVIKAVGRPDNTQKRSDDGSECWNYDNVAIDPISGKKASVQLVFPRGSKKECDSVNWN